MCHFYLPFHIVWYLHECLWMCRVSHSFWSTMSSSFLYCFVQQHSIWLTITWLSIACLCANISRPFIVENTPKYTHMCIISKTSATHFVCAYVNCFLYQYELLNATRRFYLLLTFLLWRTRIYSIPIRCGLVVQPTSGNSFVWLHKEFPERFRNNLHTYVYLIACSSEKFA